MALSAYRTLLRAARTTFHGDTPTLSAAITEAHRAFNANRHLPPASAEAQEEVQRALEVAGVLRGNVVQGRLDGGLYKLRIHDGIERGDNESIKRPPATTVAGVKCCSQ